METKVKENGKATVNHNPAKNAAFVNNNPVNKVAVKPEPEAEKPKAETAEVKTEQAKPQEEAKQAIQQPQPEPPKADAPKAESPKTEVAQATAIKEAPKKVVLNLEGTLKFIDEMYRKSKQRAKLQDTIKNLDEFDVELRDEADTTDTNYYNGCTLTIEDDHRRKFETKNPTIIWTVAQLVNNMCVEKLAEIEASIVIPQ